MQHPWVGIVNRSQADINKNVDMIIARKKEREYFETSPEYGHLAHKMGSEYLAKLLSQVFISIFYFHLVIVNSTYTLVFPIRNVLAVWYSWLCFHMLCSYFSALGEGYQAADTKHHRLDK